LTLTVREDPVPFGSVPRSSTRNAAEPSPYVELDRAQWRDLRLATPLPLDDAELGALRGLGEQLDLDEVAEVYLPLARLINLQVAARQQLHDATATFLGSMQAGTRVPFIIGVAGSVAAGKSTTARLLQALLARWPDHPQVELVTTDGFLYPTAELMRRDILDRKGFPESYDRRSLLRFVTSVKSGVERATAPVYSHETYDIVPDAEQVVSHPDILIVEGLNVLQPGPRLMVSDLFDFSVYVDAAREDLQSWYVERFLALRATAFARTASHFPTTTPRWTTSRPARKDGASGCLSTSRTWWPTSCPLVRGPRWCCARTAITRSTGCGCESYEPLGAERYRTVVRESGQRPCGTPRRRHHPGQGSQPPKRRCRAP